MEKAFKKDNVILRTADPAKMRELKLRGFEEIEWPPKKEAKKKGKAANGKEQPEGASGQ